MGSQISSEKCVRLRYTCPAIQAAEHFYKIYKIGGDAIETTHKDLGVTVDNDPKLQSYQATSGKSRKDCQHYENQLRVSPPSLCFPFSKVMLGQLLTLHPRCGTLVL